MLKKQGCVDVPLPDGFDAASILDQAGVDRKWVPHAEFMVGDIIRRRLIYGTEPLQFQDHPVQAFQSGVPRNAVAMLTKAITGTVLEAKEGGKYVYGTEGVGQCRSYRLTDEYRDRSTRRHTIESYSIWSRLTADDQKKRQQHSVKLSELPNVYRRLCEMESQFHLSASVLESEHKDCWIVDHLTVGDHSRPRWFTVCEYMRAHHAVGLTPRQLRGWLRLEGSNHSLHLADVSGSQIVLAALVCTGLLAESEWQTLADRGRERGEKKRKEKQDHCVSRRSRGCLIEAGQMIEDLLTGAFSERLLSETNTVLEKSGARPWTPDAVKIGRMSALFGDWRAVHLKPVGQALLRLYPHFMQAWSDMVSQMPHGELARMMQRVEAGIMIHGAAARIIRERPDIRFATIHDAFLCEQPHMPYVMGAIRDEWEAAVGVAPLVKQGPT